MTVARHKVTAYLPLGLSFPIGPPTDPITPLEVRSSTIVMDEKWSPFIQQTLVCAIPDGNARLFTRPDLGVRVITEVQRFDASGSSYQALRLSLVIRTTEWDYNNGTLTLTAESDETLILDQINSRLPSLPPPVEVDIPLSEMVENVIAKQPLLAGATLDSTGYSDPDVTTEVDLSASIGRNQWQYLQGLMDENDSRLWSEGGGQFFIRDRPYVAPGEVTLGVGLNARRARQEFSRNGTDWADGVLIIYRWTDDDGIPQYDGELAYEGATESDVTKWCPPIELPGPPPASPGAAQAILDRLSQRISATVIDCRPDYTVRPSQLAHITLPDETPFDGYVSRVEFRHPENLMTVTTRAAE